MNTKVITSTCISFLVLCASLTAETKPAATFEFFDINNDGKVDYKEYKTGIYEVALQIMLDQGMDKKTAKVEALKLKKAAPEEFKATDTDKNKSLSKAEFEVTHPLEKEDAATTATEETTSIDFATADADQDGKLSLKEYKEAKGKAAYDAAIEEGISKKDAKAITKKAKLATNDEFKALDTDGDKKLSPDELGQ